MWKRKSNPVKNGLKRCRWSLRGIAGGLNGPAADGALAGRRGAARWGEGGAGDRPAGVRPGHRSRERGFGEKKAPNLWVIIELIHTFASPFEKWEMAYVSTNQNQIAVLRSQSGG